MNGGDSEIVLSRAGPGDTAALATLWVEAFEPTLRCMFGSQPGAFVRAWMDHDPAIYAHTTLARIGGSAAGYLQWSGPARVSARTVWTLTRLLWHTFGFRDGAVRFLRVCVGERSHRCRRHELYIYMLGVARAWRGHGVGWRLLECAQEEARASGKTALRLGVVLDNDPALRLYHKFGFMRGPCIRSRWLRWVDGTEGYYVMTKPLA